MSILIAVLEIELYPMLIILVSFKESRGVCVKRLNNSSKHETRTKQLYDRKVKYCFYIFSDKTDNVSTL
jgi:hypothetical protein